MNQATGSPALGIAFVVVVVALALIVGAIVWSRRR